MLWHSALEQARLFIWDCLWSYKAAHKNLQQLLSRSSAFSAKSNIHSTFKKKLLQSNVLPLLCSFVLFVFNLCKHCRIKCFLKSYSFVVGEKNTLVAKIKCWYNWPKSCFNLQYTFSEIQQVTSFPAISVFIKKHGLHSIILLRKMSEFLIWHSLWLCGLFGSPVQARRISGHQSQ